MSAWEHIGRGAVFTLVALILSTANSAVERIAGTDTSSWLFRTVLIALFCGWLVRVLWRKRP